MAWFAKFDGVNGSKKATDGASNTLMLAEMDTLKFMPEKEDEVLVAFEFGDKDHDIDSRDFLVWQRSTGSSQPDDGGPDHDALAWSALASPGPNAGAYGFFLTKQPMPVDSTVGEDALGDMIAMGEDVDKPSLIVKFDIG